MGKCIDEKFGVLLYAYELGFLDEEETEKVQLHLLECEYCNKRAQNFQNYALLLRENDEIKASVSDMARPDSENGREEVLVASARGGRGKRRFWPTYLPLSIAAAIVFFILILKDWQLEFSPTDEAYAEHNTLTVLYFDNLADTADTLRFGEIITSLLITDLSESQYLHVISSQRLYDILRLLGREGEKKIDAGTGSRIAEKAKARWMLTGDILQLEPNIILTSQIVEVASGKVLASQRIDGQPEETIFSLVDELTVAIKEDLSLPLMARDEKDPLIASVTTSSLEAYRYYLEAREYYYRSLQKEAEVNLWKALEYDPDFPMAYMLLSTLGWSQRNPQKMVLIKKAMLHIDKVSSREEWYIRAVNAGISKEYAEAEKWLLKILSRFPDDKVIHYWLAWLYQMFLNKPYDAIDHLEKAIEIDSLYKKAYERLTLAYLDVENNVKAIEAADKYISLAPSEMHPYYTKGRAYTGLGEYEKAINMFEKVLLIRPDNEKALLRLGRLYLMQMEFNKAVKTFTKLTVSASSKTIRSQARTCLASVPVLTGNFERALAILDDGIASDRLEEATFGDDGYQEVKYLMKARIYAEKQDGTAAREEMEKYLQLVRSDPVETIWAKIYMIEVLADVGELIQAGREVEGLIRFIRKEKPEYEYLFGRINGFMALSRDSTEKAVSLLEAACEDYSSFNSRYLLGKAYLENGDFERAVETFTELMPLLTYDKWFESIRAVKSYYYLARALEPSGQTGKASESYKKFLLFWNEADTDIPEVLDARKRIASL